MKLKSLDEYEDKFLYYINKWNNELTRYEDTKWFDTNTNWCLQNRYKQYKDWTFLVTDDADEELVAMAAIQDFGNQVYRIQTRVYVNPKFRRKHLAYDKELVNPANIIAKHQVEQVFIHYDTKHIFFSVEFLRRRRNAMALCKKMNNFYDHNWHVPDKLYKTYDKDEKGAWQTIGLYSLVNEPFPLDSITISEWEKKYE